MLSPPDAELSRRDPAIPGLHLLLDPEAFLARLRTKLPAAGLIEAQSTYVRYKPGTSCLVKYELELAAGHTVVYAKGLRRDNQAKLEKARDRMRRPGAVRPGGFVLDDVAVAVYLFPNDHVLAPLARLGDKEWRQRLFAGIPSLRPELWNAEPHTLRYKPERRYVAQMVGNAEEYSLLKIYARDRYSYAARAAKVFVSRGPLLVARRLGRSKRHHILIVEWLPGSSLDTAIRTPGFDSSRLVSVGAALAELHAQEVSGLQHLRRETEVDSLMATASGVATLYPGWKGCIKDLVTRLGAGLAKAGGDVRSIHNDFSPDQVLLSDHGIAILDLDAAVYGDPVADLGSFVAGIELEVLRGELHPDQADTMVEAFVGGYCRARGNGLPPHLHLYIATGLLRLAPHPFRNRERDWPRQLQAILERAKAIATHGR